jgi:hypothetical protein
LKNAGKLSTKGLEIAISGTPIKQNFSWNLGANYTQYVSTVDELAGVTNIF